MLIFALSLLIPSLGRAGSPTGYYVDSVEVRSEPPVVRHESGGEYNIIVARVAPDSIMSHLLAIAECAYPPRSLLAGLAATNGYEIGSDTAKVPLWWCNGIRERRIPWAATRGALEHYLALTQKYRDNDFHVPGVYPVFTSELTYRATIARRDAFALGNRSFYDIYVADVELSWMYDDGTVWPRFTASRRVILTPEGEILVVDGDGQGTEAVSLSPNRRFGRVRTMH
jgi:hypothetical protein